MTNLELNLVLAALVGLYVAAFWTLRKREQRRDR